MNLSAENIGKIRELVRSGYPLKARDAKDLLGHNDHLVELLEARGRLMLGVEIERDQLRAEVAGLRTGYEAYEQVNAELKAENERLERNRDMWKGQVERQTEELRLAHEADKLLKSECEGLRESLTHAADEVESWGAYASDYFQQKHDLAGTVLKVRQAAVSKESGQ